MSAWRKWCSGYEVGDVWELRGPDGKGDEYEVAPGVAVFIPKDYVHWFRNLNPDKEVEICGVYSAPNAGEYKPEDYKYLGTITEEDKKLK